MKIFWDLYSNFRTIQKMLLLWKQSRTLVDSVDTFIGDSDCSQLSYTTPWPCTLHLTLHSTAARPRSPAVRSLATLRQHQPRSRPPALLTPHTRVALCNVSLGCLWVVALGHVANCRNVHTGDFPRGVGHRVENGWGLTKVAVVLLNDLIW